MIGGLVVLVFGTMAGEAVVSWRHEWRLRERGATEPAGDVFGMMLVAYPAVFVVMFTEAYFRGGVWMPALPAGVLLFSLAKALKYWAIASLGERWTFRVLVVPRARLVRAGPYRWIRHPNYVAVVGEIVGVALVTRALFTGIAGFVGFGWLLLRRIEVEERALGIK